MNRRVLVVFAGWIAAGVLATVAGVAAVQLVANDLTGPAARTVNEGDLQRRLASPSVSPDAPAQASSRPAATTSSGPAATNSADPAATNPPKAGPTVPPTSVGRAQVLTSPGGNVLARCVEGQVRLDWWTPAQGYSVEHVERGPAVQVKIEFKSPDKDVEMEIRCVAGAPTMRLD